MSGASIKASLEGLNRGVTEAKQKSEELKMEVWNNSKCAEDLLNEEGRRTVR